MTVSLTGVLLCAIIALGIVARLAFILAFRVRVLGRVTRHDYQASERRFDARGYEWDGFRDVWLRTTYDYKGVKYTTYLWSFQREMSWTQYCVCGSTPLTRTT